jgi:quercetin dioxygenase-like cupin family protein
MKRNKFIAAVMAMVTAPLFGNSQSKNTAVENGKPFKVKAGEGRIHGHITLKGVNSNILDVKISGSDTNGDLAIFEQTSISKGRGTPLHVHPGQDEVFYVLEGAYQFKCGDEKFELSAGESIFLPRKVPHAWKQVSDKGKMLVILQPAGKLENFFVTMAGLDHEPTPKEVETIFSDNEMRVVGPPLHVN